MRSNLANVPTKSNEDGLALEFSSLPKILRLVYLPRIQDLDQLSKIHRRKKCKYVSFQKRKMKKKYEITIQHHVTEAIQF